MANRFVAWRVEDTWPVDAGLERIKRLPPQNGKAANAFISRKEAKQLLGSDLAAAEIRARNVLESDPTDPDARYVLGAVLRRQGQYEAVVAILEPVTASQPHMQVAWRELGLALAKLGQHAKAIAALLRAIDLAYMDEDAWDALGDLTFPFCLGKAKTGESPKREQQLVEAQAALRDGRFEIAETILRQRIDSNPADVPALKLLADAVLGSGRREEAKSLLANCLDLAPDFVEARFRCATLFFVHKEFLAALPHIEKLLKSDTDNTLYRGMKALALSWSLQFSAAAAEFESFIEDSGQHPGLWLEYARLLRAMRSKKSVDAYKRAIAVLPSFVEAYAALAGVKTFRLDESFIDQVRIQLARPELGREDRAQLHFVLGKAFEDLGRYPESFEHYRSSNDILMGAREWGVDASTAAVKRAKGFFNPAFFRARAGFGCPEKGAIFIVGMPRSGSTLTEQILSSHSAIEALAEIDDLPDVARAFLPEQEDGSPIPYPWVLKNIDANKFRLMGEAYMEKTRRRRKLGKPFFVDKLLSNYALVGLIHLILPNARIIDARRHPLDCGWSCYKHYFPMGQPLSLDLGDIGRGYANYVETMALYDEILPGRVHRLIYERLIANFETEVRRLLDYVGLPFEEECLRFHENRRLVLTLSADQVGMPLYKTAIEHWRHYDPWLGRLKDELGYVLEMYPEVPKFYADVHAKWSKPLSLGFGTNRFATVRGVRQMPFEIARQPSSPTLPASLRP